MQVVQDLLTLVVEVIAIAGFGGIVLHAIWSHHTRWMATYCPPINTPDTQPETQSEPQLRTFNGYSQARLRKIAKELAIKRYSVMSPQQLMIAISKHPKSQQSLTA